MSHKVLGKIAFWSAVISFVVFCLGIILFVYKRNFDPLSPIDAQVFGTFGDFVGGISGTLIAFASFAYLYMGLIEQRENFRKQRDDDSITAYISSFQSRILSSDLFAGAKQCSGYNAIHVISKQLIEETEAEIDVFSRRIICKRPELIDYLLFSEMMEKIPFANAILADATLSSFIKAMEGRDSSQRWDYLKSIFGYPDNQTAQQSEILKGFGSRVFYQIQYAERQRVYASVLNRVREKYSGFLEMYIQGLEGFYFVVNSTQNMEIYYPALRNMFSLHEEVMIFYYFCSKSGSPEMKELAKNAKVFRNLASRPDLMFNLPSSEIISNEIENAL